MHISCMVGVRAGGALSPNITSANDQKCEDNRSLKHNYFDILKSESNRYI